MQRSEVIGDGALPRHVTPLEDEVIERILAPWTVQRYRTSDRAWLEIRERELRRMKKKARKRRLRSVATLLSGSFRTVGFVNERYTRTWSERPYPDVNVRQEGEKFDFYEWGEHGFVLRIVGRAALFQEAVVRALESLGPKTVLEVGCGMGTNLLVLSNLLPDVRFSGLEFTEAGVLRAREVQATQYPEALVGLSPRPMVNREAYRTVEFRQGNAAALPYPDRSFDVVYTILAVEQMESIREQAMREIVRVARSHVVMIEPLMDSNRDPLRRLAKIAKDHITLSVADLSSFGLRVETHYSGWPQKLTHGADLVVAAKVV